ncbi:MAG: chromosome segregation protein SMC, partial [Nevskiales bacterium]|nr:chromosome segregation protein SMC [Nevskiales bacterium]
MRLSAIKLAGFKSFVDPASLPLPSNLTAIVGPNGCGKSNIIDAVRWVLGESSLKQLRSDTMEDVIFNGSKTRKPAGRAAIELSFDNSDGSIQGPYAAYAEITVRRELLRDGNSQYTLNNARCLKRDVTDLFLGTGLGARSGYAIIEQGMVSNLIQAKPEELRVWIEEAAGVSKYKERRRETESRIHQTRENLSRLNDLRVELQARIEALRKQASNAEKYKEYKEQERKLKAELLALRLRAVLSQCQTYESDQAELIRGLEAARTGLSQAQNSHAQAETASRDTQQAFSAQQSKVYEAEAALARQEQNLQHARELKALKTRDLEQTAQQIEALDQREAGEQTRLTELTQTLSALEVQVQSAATQETQAQAAVSAAEQAVQAEQARWDEFTGHADAPLYRAEGERVRVQELERALNQIRERLERVQSEHGALDTGSIQSSLREADSELETLGRELAEGQTHVQTLDHQIQELSATRSAEDGALHEVRQALQGARGRLASLETLQQAALRQDDAELQTWLQGQGLTEAPRLGSVLKVEAGWEAAVEHVLDGLLQAPLLPGFAARLAELPTPPRSGLTLVDENHGSAAHSPSDRLAAKIQGPAAITELLSGIFVTSSQELAVQRVTTLRPGESVITPDGVWRGRGWARYPRAEEGHTGVLARGLLLQELRREIDGHSGRLHQHEQALEQLQTRLQTLETQRRERTVRLDSVRERQAQRLAFRQAQAVRLEQTEARARQLQQELESLRAGHEQQTQETATAREQLTGLEAVAQRLREERAALQQQLARRREEWQ